MLAGSRVSLSEPCRVFIQRLIGAGSPDPGGPVRFNLVELVANWLDCNCWTPADFALLTRSFSPPSGGLSAREISAVLSGARPELIPRHFRAFAAVERGIADINRPTTIDDAPTDLSLLSWFTSSACLDDSSRNASWWFALYCSEPWAMDTVKPMELKPSAIIPMVKELPPLLRTAISSHGLDPVSYVREAAQVLNRRTSLEPSRYVDWILEYYTLNEKELRLALPFSLLLLEQIGLSCHSLHGVKFQIESAGVIRSSRLTEPSQVPLRQLSDPGQTMAGESSTLQDPAVVSGSTPTECILT